MTKRHSPVTVSETLSAVFLCVFFALSIAVSGTLMADESEQANKDEQANQGEQVTPEGQEEQEGQVDQVEQVFFEVTPKRCVTLRQGQPCFVKLRFEWQSTEVLQVCVYGMEKEQLKCWTAATSGSTVMPQTLPGTTEYVLMDKAGVELNRTSVSVSWVYRKKRSKRRWRLF